MSQVKSWIRIRRIPENLRRNLGFRKKPAFTQHAWTSDKNINLSIFFKNKYFYRDFSAVALSEYTHQFSEYTHQMSIATIIDINYI